MLCADLDLEDFVLEMLFTYLLMKGIEKWSEPVRGGETVHLCSCLFMIADKARARVNI